MAPLDDNDAPPPGLGMRLPGLRNNPDGSMPLMEHIRELRNRIFKALLFVAVGAIIGWFLYPPVWHFIEQPYCRLNLQPPTVPGAPKLPCTLYVNGLFDGFLIRLKLAIIIGAILSAPLWLYQLWAFLAPGLYSRDRRHLRLLRDDQGPALPAEAAATRRHAADHDRHLPRLRHGHADHLRHRLRAAAGVRHAERRRGADARAVRQVAPHDHLLRLPVRRGGHPEPGPDQHAAAGDPVRGPR